MTIDFDNPIDLLMQTKEDLVYLYTKQYKNNVYENLYTKLANKHLLIIAPLFIRLMNEISEQLKHYEHIVIIKNILNDIANHFENFWQKKLTKIFSVELAILGKTNSCNTRDNQNKTYLEYFLNESYRIDLIERYPVLMNLVGTYCQNFLNFISGLLRKIKQDLPSLQNIFLDQSGTWHVEKLLFTGDPHDSGKMVTIITFSNIKSTKKVVYKPRSSSNLKAFLLLAKYISNLTNINFYFPHILDKDNYHWVEHIENTPCNSIDELSTFYRRFGSLTAICLLLRGYDLHYGNLIANGAYPCIIDFDCFFIPDLQLANPENHSTATTDKPTIIDTLLIPMLRETSDFSALTGFMRYEKDTASENNSTLRNLSVKDCKKTGKKDTASFNRPHLRKKYYDPHCFIKDIKNGFEITCDIFTKNKSLIYKKICSTLKNITVISRVVPKPTDYYTKLVKELFHPVLLRSADKFESFLNEIDNSNYSEGIKLSEKSQIMNLDIPIFFSNDEHRFVFDNKRNYIKIYGYKDYLSVLKDFLFNTLNRNYIKEQVIILEQSFESRSLNIIPNSDFNILIRNTAIKDLNVINTEKADLEIKNPDKKKSMSFDHQKSKSFLLKHSKKIIDEIINYSIRNGDLITWCNINISLSTKEKKLYDTQFAQGDFYSGTAGVLPLFYYASKIFDDKIYVDFFNHLLKSACLTFENHCNNISLFSGLGQYLYISAILHGISNNDLSDLKKKLFINIKSKISSLIEKDNTLDLIGGIAGFLLILSKTYQFFQECSLKNIIKLCATTLIKKINNFLDEKKQHFLCYPGLAHGATGVIWAIFHANNILRDSAIDEFLSKLISIERSYFDKNKNNWRVLSPNNNSTTPSYSYEKYWCHGAIGILLSRTDMYLHGHQDNFIKNELLYAAKIVDTYETPRNMNLCHGSLAYVDLYMQLEKCGLNIKSALNHYINQIHKNLKSKNYIINYPSSKIIEPSIMTGKSGLAYQILRVYYPDLIPSILLFDT